MDTSLDLLRAINQNPQLVKLKLDTSDANRKLRCDKFEVYITNSFSLYEIKNLLVDVSLILMAKNASEMMSRKPKCNILLDRRVNHSTSTKNTMSAIVDDLKSLSLTHGLDEISKVIDVQELFKNIKWVQRLKQSTLKYPLTTPENIILRWQDFLKEITTIPNEVAKVDSLANLLEIITPVLYVFTNLGDLGDFITVMCIIQGIKHIINESATTFIQQPLITFYDFKKKYPACDYDEKALVWLQSLCKTTTNENLPLPLDVSPDILSDIMQYIGKLIVPCSTKIFASVDLLVRVIGILNITTLQRQDSVKTVWKQSNEMFAMILDFFIWNPLIFQLEIRPDLDISDCMASFKNIVAECLRLQQNLLSSSGLLNTIDRKRKLFLD